MRAQRPRTSRSRRPRSASGSRSFAASTTLHCRRSSSCPSTCGSTSSSASAIPRLRPRPPRRAASPSSSETGSERRIRDRSALRSRALPGRERSRLSRRAADLRAAPADRGRVEADRGPSAGRVPAGAEADDRPREVAGDGRPRPVRGLARRAPAAVRGRVEATQPRGGIVATRSGVDVGGTFTDLIFYDDVSGEVLLAKVPTSPAEPERGVVAAVGEVPAMQVRRSAFFLHGTTVGLNAVLERRGAVVGLLATRGFRDALEIRRGDRPDPYDLFPPPAQPLVPRRLRLPVTERIRADGVVHHPLDEADVLQALATFREEGVDSIAISFINAYADPRHELDAERVLRPAGFTGDISLSHRVSGEYREYERTSTTVIDAYVRPQTAAYLSRLEERLRKTGFDGTLLVTRSGGGAMTFTEAEGRP